MWREAPETFSPDLSGDADYRNQVPLARAVPLWGGCADGGFSIVAFHQKRKLKAPEWARIVRQGHLARAIKATMPVRPHGPWSVLCDNESFLRARVSREAHAAAGVALWNMPPKSPDLNPVERCWAWLRRKLRGMDLADAVARRRVLSKAEYKARVRGIFRTQKAQLVARNQTRPMKKVCRAVLQKKGAATGF